MCRDVGVKLERPFASSLLVIFLIKVVIFALDPVPKFFFGDSGWYLETAAFNSIPPDRSFTYGFFIKATTWISSTLWPLMACQILASVISCAIAAHILREHLALSPLVACPLGILCALEPIQALYERYVMAETLSLSFLTFHLLAILHYLRGRSLLSLCLAHLLGTALISLRISFLPLTWANSLLAPILAFFGPGSKKDLSSTSKLIHEFCFARARERILGCSIHLFLSLGLMLAMHAGYKRCFAILSGSSPAYNAAGGYFLLAAWAPVVRPEDFPNDELRSKIFDQLPYDLKDRNKRANQLWEYGALIDRIRNHLPDPEGNRAAQATALNAFKRDPLGVLKLWVQSFGDYFRPELLKEKIREDLAVDEVTFFKDFLDVHAERYSIPRAERQPWTLTRRYYEGALIWYWFLLFSPAFGAMGLIFVRGHAAATALVLLVSLSSCIFAATALSVDPIVRYLHPVGWLALCLVGPVIHGLWTLRSQKRGRYSRGPCR